jgi:phosphoglucomutase
MSEFNVIRVETTPFNDQKAGTSGLRKSVKRFQEPNYVENFIQSFFNVFVSDNEARESLQIIVGGDGRYYGEECVAKILKLAAAVPKIKKVYVAKDGLMSTPAVSCCIRKYQLDGGIILTASHNPGGPNADFGIKFNCANGGPALEALTNKVFDESKIIASYEHCPELECAIHELGEHSYQINRAGDKHTLEVQVIDSVEDYLQLMKEIFDFGALRTLVKSGTRVTINAMFGVMGPYVKRIFCDELGLSEVEIVKCEPLKDFGGLHPDPNLTYAKDLMSLMEKGIHDIGAAFDGDGDRNMILGKNGFFVTPCDSVAVLAAYLHVIPYFKAHEIHGFARSMPTSGALDRVAKELGKPCFETPTGWKFFGNLMDAGQLSLCGEESFGTGSEHIREKDGLWTVLAWLSIMDFKRTSVPKILKLHWQKYGRNFFSRYDYENCDADKCKNMMQALEKKIMEPKFVGRTLNAGDMRGKDGNF